MAASLTSRTARAVEFVEQFHLNDTDGAEPTSHRHWGEDVLRILTGHQHTLRGELAFHIPAKIAFASLSNNYTLAASLRRDYINMFLPQTKNQDSYDLALKNRQDGLEQDFKPFVDPDPLLFPSFQDRFLLDEDSRLVLPDQGATFEYLKKSYHCRNPDTMRERANRFLDTQMAAIFPVCEKLYYACGMREPDGHDLRNLRLILNLQNGEIIVRQPNQIEKITDGLIGRLRDARTGSLRSNGQTIDRDDDGQPDPRDRFANWLVDQSWLRPLTTRVATLYSSFMIPDPDQTASIDIEIWKQKRAGKSVRKTIGP